MQGKLIKVEKDLYNGSHQTYENQQYGKFFKYYATFEYDGKQERGGCMSPKESENPWELNKEYTFERKENNGYINFSKIKAVDAGGFKKGTFTPKVKTRDEYKADMVSYGYRYALDLFVAGKIVKEELLTWSNNIINGMWKKLEEVEGLK